MPSRDLGARGWYKPWSDDPGGACAGTRKPGDGRGALRRSTDPDGTAPVLTPREMTNFLIRAKAARADFPL